MLYKIKLAKWNSQWKRKKNEYTKINSLIKIPQLRDFYKENYFLHIAAYLSTSAWFLLYVAMTWALQAVCLSRVPSFSIFASSARDSVYFPIMKNVLYRILRTSCVAGFFSKYAFEREIVERYRFSLYAFVISANQTFVEEGGVTGFGVWLGTEVPVAVDTEIIGFLAMPL